MSKERFRFVSPGRPGGGPDRHFIAGFAGHLRHWRDYLAASHLPRGGHRVPVDFAGIAVAASPDPAGDVWLIEALRDLGIGQVRLDYSYESPGGHGERLLGQLLDHSFSVLLHFVQPYAEARRMPAAEAVGQWREFIRHTLDAWGDRLTMVEVGSTINRRRWAGYNLSGWLAAWTAAWNEISHRDLTLLGVNITDFDPFFDHAALALLEKRDLLPDIHTVNLFAERATEPEAWDRKVLGARAAPLLKANLVYKADIVSRVGRHHGIERTYSTNAFWTLPRISRMLAAVEEKQADYVARYLLLAAAGGVLGRAYYGPMISQREGLVDDGTDFYPELEQVTYYGQANGRVADYRKRPAFQTMRQFLHTVPGALYQGALNSGRGLEMHCFERASDIVHVAWTMNGKCAVLAELYSQDDLRAAQCTDRDGVRLGQPPDLITESPLYLSWPKPTVLSSVQAGKPMPGIVVANSGVAGKYFYHCDQSWRGIVVAGCREQAAKIWAQLHPGKIAGLIRSSAASPTPGGRYEISDPRRDGGVLEIIGSDPAPFFLLSFLLRRKVRARDRWNAACELLRRGVASPPPVAWFERCDRSRPNEGWFLRQIDGKEKTTADFFAAFARGELTHCEIEAGEFYRQLTQFLSESHRRGVEFRRIKPDQILVRVDSERQLCFALDWPAGVCFHPRALSLRRCLSDLGRICRGLPWPTKCNIVELYLSFSGMPFSRSRRWSFFLRDVIARIGKG